MPDAMANISWAALGSTAVVRGPRASLHAAQRAAACVVDQIDRLASRFRPDSELNQINMAAGHWTVISAELAELVELGISAAEQTRRRSGSNSRQGAFETRL